MKIQVTGEVGRQINPWDSYRKNQSAVGMCIERVEAEKHIQSFPAPGIEDGEHEAYLQRQAEYSWNKRTWYDVTEEWYEDMKDASANNYRQIWKLTPKAK